MVRWPPLTIISLGFFFLGKLLKVLIIVLSYFLSDIVFQQFIYQEDEENETEVQAEIDKVLAELTAGALGKAPDALTGTTNWYRQFIIYR